MYCFLSAGFIHLQCISICTVVDLGLDHKHIVNLYVHYLDVYIRYIMHIYILMEVRHLNSDRLALCCIAAMLSSYSR